MYKLSERCFARAAQVLSTKHNGPAGMIPFMWANATREVHVVEHDGQKFSYDHPFLDAHSNVTPTPHYGLVVTDRTGLEVHTFPAGTQDVVFEYNGFPYSAELSKPQQQAALLKDLLGIQTSEPMNNQLFLAYLFYAWPHVYDIKLESLFDTAARETHEEHGWKYANQKTLALSNLGDSFATKRNIDDPTLPLSEQLAYVAHVQNFDDTIPKRKSGIETKVSQDQGRSYIEQGVFVTYDQMKNQFEIAKVKAAQSEENFSSLAQAELMATQNRLSMMSWVNHLANADLI